MSATAAPHRPPGGRSLFITGLGIGQVISWGTLYYSFPLIAQAMGQELGWSKAELYGAATLGLALAGLVAYPVGAGIDAGYGRLIMAGGSVLAGLLFMLWAHADGMALFYVAVAGIGAMQAATLYDPAFAVIARRVGASQARAGITALTLWGGFASTVFIPLVQLLIDTVGWRDTLMILGAINVFVSAAVNFAVIDPRADAPVPATRGIGETPGPSALAEALRQPAFWALALSFTAYAVMFSGFTFHAYPLLIERGFDTHTVVTAIAVIGPAQVAGRIAIWVFAPRAPMRIVGALTVAVFPLAFLALEFMPPDFIGVALFGVVFGAVNGITTIVRGLVVPEMLTRRAYGAVNGAMAVPATVARALAPVGLAMLWAATGSYDAVLGGIILASVVVAAGFWTAVVLSKPADPV